MDKLTKNNHVDENNKLTSEDTNAIKRMPVWGLIAIDITLTAIFLGVFMLFHLVLPQQLANKEIIVATLEDSAENTFNLPGSANVENSDSNTGTGSSNDADSNNSTDNSVTNSNSASGSNNVTDSNNTASNNEADNNEAGSNNKTEDNNATENGTTENSTGSNNASGTGNSGGVKNLAPRSDFNGNKSGDGYGNTNTTEISSDLSDSASIKTDEAIVTEVNRFSNDNIEFVTNKVELGSGNKKITYYISDIYITNVKFLKTAFALGKYGKNLREETLEVAEDNNALLAISGDFYGNSEIGVVIRNGVLYRSEVVDADICVLFTDGTMKTFLPEEFDAEEVIAQGAWQAWTFGPELLDGSGNILSTFNTTFYLNSSNPRCSIGYVEKGHYVFAVVDGREPGYSKGASLSELAKIMADAGCMVAYNLDGGKSAAMVYQGEDVNKPAQGGRTISDIIYIGE